MRRLPATLLVTAVAAAVTIPGSVRAFDWNGRTATHELDVFDGRMRIESGHPLATARAFRLAAAAGVDDARTQAALFELYGEDLASDRSDAMQTVLFGSWLNEIRTNVDMGGSLPMEWAARYLRWRYAKYLDGRVHSDRWSQDTGYTSSNYQHSMMVTSIDPAVTMTQDDVFDVLRDYVRWALVAAVMNLIVAQKGLRDGSLDSDQIDESWISGLRYVGSVFHLLEDSSVSCTPEAHALVPQCAPGDGHTILDRNADGVRQVVTLSDNEFYERHVDDGSKPHGLLDDLYREENIEAVYGEFDPALVNSRILIGVAVAVAEAMVELEGVGLYNADGSLNDAFDAQAFRLSRIAGEEIWDDAIASRYAAPEDRVALPALPTPGGDDPFDAWGDPTPEPAVMGAASCSSTGAIPIGRDGSLIVLVGAWLLIVGSRLAARARSRRAA